MSDAEIKLRCECRAEQSEATMRSGSGRATPQVRNKKSQGVDNAASPKGSPGLKHEAGGKLKKWPLAVMALLFFAGVASILYPFVGNLLSVMQSNDTISEYNEAVEEMPSAEIKAILKEAQEYNSGLYTGERTEAGADCLSEDGGVICYVDVPSVGIYLPVYYGTSDEILEKGCGCLENTSLPVGGENTHSVISGHTGLPNAEMFTSLDRAELGDVFYIHVLGEVLAYRIDKIQDVTPDQTDELRIIEGGDYVTLLTCTPYGINDKRLLVRGVRIAYEETAETSGTAVTEAPTDDSELSANVAGQVWIVALIALAAIGVFISACFMLRADTRKQEQEPAERRGNDSPPRHEEPPPRHME